jgi:7-cyano-7-deazaguanine synthase
MNRKAFVLLSGGIDSTTCLFHAIYDFAPTTMPIYGDKNIIAEIVGSLVDGTKNTDEVKIDWVEAVSVNYGQRHQKEIQQAKKICDILGIQHTVLDVGDLLKGKTVMLSADSMGTVEVPNISYGDIKGVSPTYVPFRNGLLLSAITAYAQKWVNAQIAEERQYLIDASHALNHGGNEGQIATDRARDTAGVYFGAHSEDAANWAYPDCTPEFIGAMANAIYTGSYYAIRLHTPLEWLGKSDIVRLGGRLDVPYELTWSCYKGEEKHCGVCPTCRARKQGFIDAKVVDPTEYAA